MELKSHKDLTVYKESIELVLNIYKITEDFPNDEKYGLVSQMKRSAVSVPSNIAEGSARNSKKEFIRFFFFFLGSASELETQIEIATKLGFKINTEEVSNRLFYIKRMLLKLIESIRRKIE